MTEFNIDDQSLTKIILFNFNVTPCDYERFLDLPIKELKKAIRRTIGKLAELDLLLEKRRHSFDWYGLQGEIWRDKDDEYD